MIFTLIILAYFLRAPLEDLIGHLRSEYQPIEILSGTFLLAGFFAALDASLPSEEGGISRITAPAFVVLFAAAYLSENNMLPGIFQPLVALPLMGLLLWRLRRETKSCIAMLAALAFFAAGFAADFVNDLWRHASHMGIAEPTPSWMHSFSRGEEIYEASAEALLLWAVLENGWVRLGSLCAGRYTETVGAGMGLLLLATGNGLLHAGYNPSDALRGSAFAISTTGLAGFLAAARKLSGRRLTAEILLLMYSFLVLIPTVHGKIPGYISAAVWLPVVTGVTLRMVVLRRSLP